MKPSPQSQGFIYKNQTPSAISDQKQQPSGQGYQGRTGKAINCQSLHRSTSQSTTTIHPCPPPPHSANRHTHTHTVYRLLLYSARACTDTDTCIYALLKLLSFCAPTLRDGWHLVEFVSFLFEPWYLLNYLESRLQYQHAVRFR